MWGKNMIDTTHLPDLVNYATREMPLLVAKRFYDQLPILHCPHCFTPLPVRMRMYPVLRGEGWIVPNEVTKMWIFIECKKCKNLWSLDKLGFAGKQLEKPVILATSVKNLDAPWPELDRLIEKSEKLFEQEQMAMTPHNHRYHRILQRLPNATYYMYYCEVCGHYCFQQEIFAPNEIVGELVREVKEPYTK
jgi:hypothetical protein